MLLASGETFFSAKFQFNLRSHQKVRRELIAAGPALIISFFCNLDVKNGVSFYKLVLRPFQVDLQLSIGLMAVYVFFCDFLINDFLPYSDKFFPQSHLSLKSPPVFLEYLQLCPVTSVLLYHMF